MSAVCGLLRISCTVALQSQQHPSSPCQPGKWKISLKAFQSAFTTDKAALNPCGLPASLCLALSVGSQSRKSCRCKGCAPQAKDCKLQIRIPKTCSKVLADSRLCSKQVKGILRFIHSGTPGIPKFMTSKLCDLSQL